MLTTKMKEVKNKNAHMNMLVLPQEILQMVFKFLDPRTIFSISQVSKFNNLSSFNIQLSERISDRLTNVHRYTALQKLIFCSRCVKILDQLVTQCVKQNVQLTFLRIYSQNFGKSLDYQRLLITLRSVNQSDQV